MDNKEESSLIVSPSSQLQQVDGQLTEGLLLGFHDFIAVALARNVDAMSLFELLTIVLLIIVSVVSLSLRFLMDYV